MNAPTQVAHLVPEINQRDVPVALIDALKARFGANCSTAMAVRTAPAMPVPNTAPGGGVPTNWKLSVPGTVVGPA